MFIILELVEKINEVTKEFILNNINIKESELEEIPSEG